MASLFWMI